MLPTYQSYQLFNLFSIANFVYLSICIWHLAVVFFQVHFDWDFLFLFFQIQKRKLSVLENERKIFSFFDSEGERERERKTIYLGYFTWDISFFSVWCACLFTILPFVCAGIIFLVCFFSTISTPPPPPP